MHDIEHCQPRIYEVSGSPRVWHVVENLNFHSHQGSVRRRGRIGAREFYNTRYDTITHYNKLYVAYYAIMHLNKL